MTTALRIVAPQFVAGLIVNNVGLIIRTAPILHWTKGKTDAELKDYCRRRGWTWESVELSC